MEDARVQRRACRWLHLNEGQGIPNESIGRTLINDLQAVTDHDHDEPRLLRYGTFLSAWIRRGTIDFIHDA